MYLDKKDLYPEYIKNSSNSTIKRQSNLKLGKGFVIHFSKDIQIANKHIKRCSLSLVIREMEIKTTMRCYLTPTERQLSKNQKITSVGGYGKIGVLVHC